MKLHGLSGALGSLGVVECLTQELGRQADRLKGAIKENLDGLPGESHDQPWRQTGHLQDSISAVVNGLTAQVGSNDPAAAAQEFGTLHDPPRPFVGPAASSLMESIAEDVALALIQLLTGRVQ